LKKKESLPIPLQDRVLVRRIPEPEGIIIKPDVAKEKPFEAMVLAVGPGKWREDEWGRHKIEMQVKVGQKVLLSPSVNCGTWSDLVEENGFLMVQEADLLGILEG
jgi:chaperonin GroES